MADAVHQDRAPAGTGLRRADLSGCDVVIGAISALVAVGLMAIAAYDVRPLGGESVIYAVGFVAVALLHGSVAAGLVGLYIEWRHPRWTFFREWQHVLLALALLVLVAATVYVDWWILSQSISTRPLIGFSVAIGLGVLGGGTLNYLIAAPNFLVEGGAERIAISFGFAAVGILTGVAAAVLLVVSVAYVRNRGGPEKVATPPTVHRVVGTYVALGDSYSAGEGLQPFSPRTGSASADQGAGCHRSNLTYSQWLRFDDPQPAERLVACSGAVTIDATKDYNVTEHDGSTFTVGPQVDGPHPEVGLVTVTMGGNDVLFSRIVIHCISHDHCMDADFTAPDLSRRTTDFPPTQPLGQWAVQTAEQLSPHLATLYTTLRTDYPNARIVVIGYPYLFPSGPGGFRLTDCDSVLRRFSGRERDQLRSLQDQFNDLLYEQAISAGIEFVSPDAAWDGHEPCGRGGQYTNAIKPIVSKDLVDGGTFHPNASGQEALGRLVACYLDANPTVPDAQVEHRPLPLTITGLVSPATLGLVDAPGILGHPISC